MFTIDNKIVETLFGMHGKVALVTGAGRGIGREVALAYAGAGADLAIASRTAAELDEVAAQIRAMGRRVLAIPADMTEIAALPALVDRVVDELGAIDVLVNNAGLSRRDPVLEATIEDFDYMVDLNLKSVMVQSQRAVHHMRKSGRGKIVNVTSMTSVVADVGSGVYGMTKSGLTMLSKGFAVEIAKEGLNIQVNCVGPGLHATSQWKEIIKHEPHHEPHLLAKIPMGRAADPQEIVGAFLFLAGTASDYMTGQTLYMDGGWLSA